MALRTTRRDFFRLTGAGTLGTAALLAGADSPILAQGTAGRPRRVIFCVSDGMSLGVLSLADQFSRLVRGTGTHFRTLLENPKAAHGFFETYSLNTLVTDSAAAASAWGSGSRVFNAAINVLPDGRRLTPICPLVKQAGFGTGLVTTATVTHATPAGFAAVTPRRDAEGEIASQYKGTVDVVMGAGRQFFPEELRREYAADGYSVFSSRAEMAGLAEAPARILGLFGSDRGHLPYTVDHRQSDRLRNEVPTLVEMTRAALDSLHRHHPNGFLLQVEGARVDHAAHSNDAAAILWDQLAFDDAVGAALDFAARVGDTLVVVTSDHGNANPGLNGMNREYVDSTPFFHRLKEAKASYGEIERRLNSGGAPTVEGTIAAIGENLGITLSPEEAKLVADAAAGRPGPVINAQHRRFMGILGQVLGNHTGIGWTGTTHTEDYTVIAAAGPGQDAWRGLLKNTDAFRLMADAFGVRHTNAAMTESEAAPFIRREREQARLLGAEERPHWA